MENWNADDSPGHIDSRDPHKTGFRLEVYPRNPRPEREPIAVFNNLSAYQYDSFVILFASLTLYDSCQYVFYDINDLVYHSNNPNRWPQGSARQTKKENYRE